MTSPVSQAVIELCCVTETDLNVPFLLPPPPEPWDYSCRVFSQLVIKLGGPR